MTRIAAGHPGIWPDICAENRVAIVDALDAPDRPPRPHARTVAGDERPDALLGRCSTRARDARINLPGRVARAPRLAEVRIRIPDRPGAAAEVFTLAAELGVNVADFEIVPLGRGRPRAC